MNNLNSATARRTLVFRSSAIVVAIIVVAAIAGWQFYGLGTPPPQPVGDPIQKVGTGAAPSNNPITLDEK